MTRFFLAIVFVFAILSVGHTQTSISVFDFIKIKNNKRQEAIYYYENNWKVYRDIAWQKGFIKSYTLLSVLPDTTAENFNLILVTEYADSLQLKLSEERFNAIIKSTRPNGPELLNELKPGDFRENVFFKRTETLFTADKK